MIKKERLEELFEKDAPIYRVENNKVCSTKPKKYWSIGEDRIYWTGYKEIYIKFNELFETKEDAEEYAEFGNIPRIEWLELPSWEEMQDKLNKEEFVEKYYFYSKHFYKANRDTINIDYTYSIYLMPNGLIIIDDNEKPKTLFSKPLTRENYNEARRLCVKLFKGEEV